MYDKKRYRLNKKKFVRSLLIIIIIVSIPTFIVKNLINKNSKKSSTTYLSHKDESVKKAGEEDKLSMIKKGNEEDLKNNKPLDIAITDYTSFFKDSVILGDSISESISYYSVLSENNVVAVKGLTVYKARKQIPNVISKSPKKLFILLGNNDLFEEKLTENQFIKQYSILIDNLEKSLPNCKIYILSILPVTDKAEKENPFLNDKRILSFNDAIKSMTEKYSLNYINILPVIQGKENLYEPDGIHFKYDFYKYLLSYIETYIKENNI